MTNSFNTPNNNNAFQHKRQGKYKDFKEQPQTNTELIASINQLNLFE